MYEWLSLGWSAGFKHLQHAVGDQKSADDVARGRNYGDKAENKSQAAFMFADQNDRAQYRDSVQRVGQRHEWRVQKRRYAPDHFKADKGCQHEDEESVYELELHICCLGRARLQPGPPRSFSPSHSEQSVAAGEDARNLLSWFRPSGAGSFPRFYPARSRAGLEFCTAPRLLQTALSTTLTASALKP